MTNKTAAFLGAEHAWNKAQLELRDVQPLGGGVRVLVPSFTAHQVFVTCFAPDGQETRYKLRLGWNEKQALCDLCVVQDFVTIEGGETPGLPDEARPAITLTNARRESHTVALWAGAVGENGRFAEVYRALLALAERTAGQRPMARKLESREKWLLLAGLTLVVALLATVATFPAQALVAALWPGRFELLFGVHAALMVSLLGVMALLGRMERRKAAWDRTFTNPFMLAVVNVFFFLGLVGTTGMVEVAIAIWRGAALPAGPLAAPMAGGDERALYGILAYTAVFTAWLALLAAGLVGERLLRWLDARW